MKMSHKALIVISGMVWFGIGFYLLQLGLNLLLIAIPFSYLVSHPLLHFFTSFSGSGEAAALLLIAIALFIGFLKGRFVLGKSAKRGVDRIFTLPNPSSLTKIYNSRYYILLAVMVMLGMSVKYLGLSNDVRGFVDTIIGSALINGAIVYFKLAQTASNASVKR